MAVKTFTNEILTASDTNTYLANAGFITIAGGTFTNATTVDITGFSTAYKFYRIVYRARRTDAVGSRSATAQWRSSTTSVAAGYYYGAGYASYAGGAGSLTSGNNVGSMWWVGADSFAVESVMMLDVTMLSADSASWTGTGWYSGAAYNFHYGGAVTTTLALDRLRITYDGAGVRGEWIVLADRTYT
jgi:hypothetical protein